MPARLLIDRYLLRDLRKSENFPEFEMSVRSNNFPLDVLVPSKIVITSISKFVESIALANLCNSLEGPSRVANLKAGGNLAEVLSESSFCAI